MVSVYFNPNSMQTSLDGVIDQGKLLHVADVDVPTLGKAYSAMQNGQEDWVDHPRVTVQPGLEETFARSLSAGDVLELDGQRYLLLVVGYHPLQPGDTQGPTAEEAFVPTWTPVSHVSTAEGDATNAPSPTYLPVRFFPFAGSPASSPCGGCAASVARCFCKSSMTTAWNSSNLRLVEASTSSLRWLSANCCANW